MSVSAFAPLVVGDPASGMLPVGALAFAVVVIVVALVVAVRRTRATVGAGDTPPTADSLASARLVEVDDAVRTAAQVISTGAGHGGEIELARLAEAQTAARALVDQALAIRRKSDAADAGESSARRILELCAEADAMLTAATTEFDDLRMLESSAPQALARVLAESAAAKARVAGTYAAVSARRPGIDSSLEGMQSVALGAVASNPIQAQRLLVFVGTAVSAATTGITKGDAVRTTNAVRSAQAAIAQVTQLLDVVDRVVTLGGSVSSVELVDAVEQFIDTRRGAVGVEARIRLMEASAQVASAEDPDTVADLAGTALSLALDDVVRYELVPSGQSDDGSDAARLGGITISARAKRR